MEPSPDNIILTIFFSIISLIFSAFFSSSEAAFLSIQKTKLSHIPDSKSDDKVPLSTILLQQRGRLLATVLLGNNLANVAFVALVTTQVITWLPDYPSQAAVISTVLSTALLLVFGEVLPKTFAVRHSEKLVVVFAKPIRFFELLFYPFVRILQLLADNQILGNKTVEKETLVTEAEIRNLIDIGEAEGSVDPDEAELLESVFRFGDKHVREVMTPRADIIFVERGVSLETFLSLYEKDMHSRYPVYKGNTDNVVGLLSLKDMIKAFSAKTVSLDDSVTDVIRDGYFVPETKRIAELFEELRNSGHQMAIVVDEFGGVSGLVTMKQLLEEIVGPVGEEGVGPEDEYSDLGENTFQIDGNMGLEELEDELDIHFPDGDYETIAGFVLYYLGHLPLQGEQFQYEGIKIEIISMDGMKIDKLKVQRIY
ncbi:MAG: hemolysin [Chloroflexi bacterium]|nr:hemolysin [Chloroflexota bacterium]MCH2308453.1 hemolysin family protein [SAR202 cluster bacterium]MQG05188.1 HlyC/CorC family transporter [SAR202 cluster bacterium]